MKILTVTNYYLSHFIGEHKIDFEYMLSIRVIQSITIE